MRKDVICLGLLDKDSKVQEIGTLDAYKLASNLFAETTGGATITEGRGVYTHKNGEVIIEPTLICTVYGSDDKTIRSTADLLKIAFNQESVVIETSESNSVFY